jgi:adenosyl cobinamide kinase/adenosyl cobinamide phosphate guanylyltransferase
MVLLLGGARSGKSTLAVQLAARHRHVTFLATAEPGDEEMRSRIAAHRSERPGTWATVEEPLELARAIDAVDPASCLVIDCLSLWAANRLGAGGAVVEAEARDAAAAAARRSATTIAVSNEVGMGVVPASELGRAFRDTLGRVNAIWAAAATDCFLVVAGRRLELRA